MTRKPTDPFYHTDRFKIKWLDDPEGGVKSDCGRFILRGLEPYQLLSGKWVRPYVLIDNSPTWFEYHKTTSRRYRRRADALRNAETRRRHWP